MEATTTLVAPAIGKKWQGGIYAGLVAGDAGEPDYHLIVGPELGKFNFEDAGAEAKSCRDGDHDDWSLPKRKEQSVMFGNVPKLFKREWYWSSEQYAPDAGYAWYQNFLGLQGYPRKSAELRARAVRRVPIR